MTAKRVFDLTVLLACLCIAGPVFCVAALASLIVQGRPILFRSRRVGQHGRGFTLIKLRTMVVSPPGSERVLGGDSNCLVTPIGGWLRRHRIDELPQFWNVLRGEMSVVGPRPPLPDYVGATLSCPPGLTGLATVVICAREERLLSRCRSEAETDSVYRRRCLPVKQRIDRIYAARQSIGLDLYVLYLTMARMLPLPGRRAQRLWRDARRNSLADRHAFLPPQPRLSLAAAPVPQLSRNARLK